MRKLVFFFMLFVLAGQSACRAQEEPKELVRQSLGNNQKQWDYINQTFFIDAYKKNNTNVNYMIQTIGISLAALPGSLWAALLSFDTCKNYFQATKNNQKASTLTLVRDIVVPIALLIGVPLITQKIISLVINKKTTRNILTNFVKNWKINKGLTPKELHPLFKPLYKEYEKTRSEKQLSELLGETLQLIERILYRQKPEFVAINKKEQGKNRPSIIGWSLAVLCVAITAKAIVDRFSGPQEPVPPTPKPDPKKKPKPPEPDPTLDPRKKPKPPEPDPDPTLDPKKKPKPKPRPRS